MRDRRGVLVLLAGIAVLTGCGSSQPAQRQQPSAKLEHFRGGSVLSVVLTPLGAQRIGIQTARVGVVAPRFRPVTAVVPYSSIVYEPDGSAVVYTNPAPDVFTRQPVSIDHISGAVAYITRGPAPGSQVVTVGAEELLGVQHGVGVET